MKKLYRHGDVIVQEASKLLRAAERIPGLVLAHGELTGHTHRIQEGPGTATLYRHPDGRLFFTVNTDFVTLVHEEHGPIRLAPGIYRAWHQREYLPGARRGEVRFRPVMD